MSDVPREILDDLTYAKVEVCEQEVEFVRLLMKKGIVDKLVNDIEDLNAARYYIAHIAHRHCFALQMIANLRYVMCRMEKALDGALQQLGRDPIWPDSAVGIVTAGLDSETEEEQERRFKAALKRYKLKSRMARLVKRRS
jgi:hypothetical protein